MGIAFNCSYSWTNFTCGSWITVWADADTWFERQQQEEEMQRIQKENQTAMKAAEELHRKQLAEEREGEKDDPDTKDDPMAVAEAESLKQSNS